MIGVEGQRHRAASAIAPAVGAERPAGAHPLDDAPPALLRPLPWLLLLFRLVLGCFYAAVSVGLSVAFGLLEFNKNYVSFFIAWEFLRTALESEKFALSQSRCHIQQDHDLLPRLQRRQQLPDFVASEHVRSTAAFGTLPHPMNWVAVVEIVATGMVEQNAHHVPNFEFCSKSRLLVPDV